jgi:hypothetical protein
MSNSSQVMEEINNIGEPDVEGTDLSLPREIETAIAARQRQLLRNSAVLAQMNLRLARRRDSQDEVKAHSKTFDQHLRDIAELDRMYPEAKALMAEMDKQSIAQTKESRTEK